MRRALIATAVIAAIAAPALARKHKRKAARKGRVVRVERSRNVAGHLIRVCQNIQSSGEATCWGRPPRVNELGTVMDETGVRATVRVDRVDPIPDSCQNESSWKVTGHVESGDLSTISWQANLLFDYERSSSRIIQQNGQFQIPTTRQENLMTAVDLDADDQPELIVSWYYCDQTGAMQAYGAQSTAYCMVYYEREYASRDYDELRVDIVRNCY